MYYVGNTGRRSVPWAVYRDEDHPACAALAPTVALDYFGLESSAAHAVSLLNRGLATVEPHRPLGCRVQPVPATAPPAAA